MQPRLLDSGLKSTLYGEYGPNDSQQPTAEDKQGLQSESIFEEAAEKHEAL